MLIGGKKDTEIMKSRPKVCIDLDGTIANDSIGYQGFDIIGNPIPGAKEFVNELAKLAEIIIFTCRCGSDLHPKIAPYLLVNKVKKWLDDNGFIYDHIWTENGKPIADAYVDDRGVSCQPQNDKLAYVNAMIEVKKLCNQ